MVKPASRSDFQADALDAVRQALGPDRLFTDAATVAMYASDSTPRACAPIGIVFPHCHDEVVALTKLANHARLALIPRAGGSGNVGGALPVTGSLVVSFECMRRVLEFRPADRLIVVEPGVVTADIDRLARTAGLFYPPDPGSAEYCRIGGNIAMNAAGPRSVKYGVTRDYVLGLRAVTGTGASLRTGCRTTKGVVGYDLTRLLVGSEGTLAMVTEATLRLVPAPTAVGTLRACYDHTVHASEAIARVMAQPAAPCAVEFMDGASIGALRETGSAGDLPAGTRALLMVEADGEPEEVQRALAALSRALSGNGLLELEHATDPAAVKRLWTARRALSLAVRKLAPYKINEDVVVPVSRLAELVARIEALARAHRLRIVSFGHGGNGNLHVNIMVDPADADEMQRAKRCVRELFAAVLELGGTLSGEHGIGSEKRDYVDMEIEPQTLQLMRAIKREFDPNAILNPGKALPDVP